MTYGIPECRVIERLVDDLIQRLFSQQTQRIHVAEYPDVEGQERALKFISRVALDEYLLARRIEDADVDNGVRFPSYVLAAVQLLNDPRNLICTRASCEKSTFLKAI